jgi:DNA-binding NarL/FixJ family response regulator
METIRIAIVDDHAILREGLRALLAMDPAFEVVGEAGTGWSGVEIAEALTPDVILLDIKLPDFCGLAVCRTLRERAPGCRVVVLSMCAEEPYAVEALRSGALGYVLKEESLETLATAVRAVVKGERYLSPKLDADAIEAALIEDEPDRITNAAS